MEANRSVWLALSAALMSACLLCVSTHSALSRRGDEIWEQLTRRYWEDVYLAVGHRLTGLFPVSNRARKTIRTPSGRRTVEARPTLTEAAAAAGIRPWQFWRVVPLESFVRRRPPPVSPRYDDPGRPLLLSAGFALLGGVSPFLIHWMGLVSAVPVLFWLSLELARAGLRTTAVAAPLLVGVFPFFAELLALDYSAMGFYLIALLTVAAVAVHCALHPRPRPSGLWLRAAVAAVVLGVCALCRSSSMLAGPGIAAALLVGFARARPPDAPLSRSLASAALATLLLGAPFLALTAGVEALTREAASRGRGSGELRPQQHPVWHGMWIGLGDFDRTRGYTFDDRAAFDAIVAAGGTASTTRHYDPENEAILRRMILRDILESPAWFLEILGKRTLSTLAQAKLWPSSREDGSSFARSTAPNEGVTDAYYELTATADWVGVGRWRVEAPALLLVTPGALLVGLTLLHATRSGSRETGRRLWGALGATTCVAVSALVHPVLVTTASALETEAFLLVYVLAAAFLLEEAARTLLPRLRGGDGEASP